MTNDKVDLRELSEPQVNDHLNYVLKEAHKSYKDYLQKSSNLDEHNLSGALEFFLNDSISRYKLHALMVLLNDLELLGYNDFRIIALKDVKPNSPPPEDLKL